MERFFMTKSTNILNFKEFNSWVVTLNKLDADLWTKPIAEGKWSISEIVSHIMNWDNHIISQILPSVRQGKEISFPPIDTYNQKASDYAKSGITQTDLIEEVIRTREHLVTQLMEMPDDLYNSEVNNYSLAFLIKEFVKHDNEHKAQINQFISKSNLE
jgi:uncharacterized damage-inducible protein DinB